jgi:hypothetical protein
VQGGRYIERKATAEHTQCTSKEFGGDPEPDDKKTCYCQRYGNDPLPMNDADWAYVKPKSSSDYEAERKKEAAALKLERGVKHVEGIKAAKKAKKERVVKEKKAKKEKVVKEKAKKKAERKGLLAYVNRCKPMTSVWVGPGIVTSPHSNSGWENQIILTIQPDGTISGQSFSGRSNTHIMFASIYGRRYKNEITLYFDYRRSGTRVDMYSGGLNFNKYGEVEMNLYYFKGQCKGVSPYKRCEYNDIKFDQNHMQNGMSCHSHMGKYKWCRAAAAAGLLSTHYKMAQQLKLVAHDVIPGQENARIPGGWGILPYRKAVCNPSVTHDPRVPRPKYGWSKSQICDVFSNIQCYCTYESDNCRRCRATMENNKGTTYKSYGHRTACRRFWKNNDIGGIDRNAPYFACAAFPDLYHYCWSKCADEGGACKGLGLSAHGGVVRFGVEGGRYIEKGKFVNNDPVPCTSKFFGGDPEPGKKKTCYYQRFAANGMPMTSADWQQPGVKPKSSSDYEAERKKEAAALKLVKAMKHAAALKAKKKAKKEKAAKEKAQKKVAKKELLAYATRCKPMTSVWVGPIDSITTAHADTKLASQIVLTFQPDGTVIGKNWKLGRSNQQMLNPKIYGRRSQYNWIELWFDYRSVMDPYRVDNYRGEMKWNSKGEVELMFYYFKKKSASTSLMRRRSVLRHI